MKTLFSTLLTFSTLLALPAWADSPFTGKSGALTFAIDGSKSQIKFLSDAPAEKIPGTAEGASGEIKVADAANPASTTGKVSVAVDKMKTGNDLRDKHLKGPDWLNAGSNPTISFAIDKVEITKVEGNRATGKAHGTFTLNGKGVAKVVSIDIAYAADKNALKVTGKFKVSLKDHAVAGKAGVVGNKVGEQIDIDMTLYASGK
jgi:polyisoprenoid-binding protein YceI